MQSKALTVEQYLAQLPADRRAAMEAVRKVILQNLDKNYQEGMSYGMIGYFVPHSVYPAGYHCDPKQPLPFAGLASQKGYMSVYLTCVYNDPSQLKWLQSAWAKAGKKLDMGKSCIRFKKLDDLPLEVLGQAIKQVPAQTFIRQYEASLAASGKGRAPAPKKSPASPARGSGTAPKPKPKSAKKAPPNSRSARSRSSIG